MRVAALVLGVLAGLVASLILALGGLDGTSDLGITAERQVQAIHFGLFIVGNLGFFGAALALAAPLAGGVVLVVAALAWAAAALLMRHGADMVLIVPPALLLVAAAVAIVAHFRSPTPARAETADEDDEEDEDSDVEILSPERTERTGLRPSEMMDGEEEVGVPAFASDSSARPGPQARENDWNPRKRPPPPPRAKPAFRPIEEEYEDDEPSGFSRFAMGMTGFLSFGLYAALAGAAILIFWNARNADDQPSAVVAEAPVVSSSEPSSSEPPRLASTEETLTPILTGEPIRDIATNPTAPSTSPSELVAEATTSSEPATFGAVSTGEDGAIPTLSDDFNNAEASLPPVSANPPSIAEEPSSEQPTALGFEASSAPSSEPSAEPATPTSTATTQPTTVPAGMSWPRAVPPTIAAQRMAPGTGPTTVPTQPANFNNTGL